MSKTYYFQNASGVTVKASGKDSDRARVAAKKACSAEEKTWVGMKLVKITNELV